MSSNLNRRQLLKLSALASAGGLLAACSVPAVQAPAGVPPTPTAAEANLDPAAASAVSESSSLYPASAPLPDAPTLAGRLALAATNFLDSLGDLRAIATFAFEDAERV